MKKLRAKKRYEPFNYWNDLLGRDFSLSGVGFLGLGKSYNEWLYRARRRVFHEIANKYLNNPELESVLDIGCGTGFYIDLWNKLGVKRLSAIDLTEVSIEKLRKKYPDYEFFRRDIGEKLDAFNNKAFDFVTAFDVLFHIVDDDRFERAIHNISKNAKSGGYVFISDNLPKVDKAAVYCQRNRTLKQYIEVLERYDLSIVEIRPIFFFMNAPVDLIGKSSFSKFAWKMIWRTIKLFVKNGEGMANATGRGLYYLDQIVLSLYNDSPTTKFMVIKKN